MDKQRFITIKIYVETHEQLMQAMLQEAARRKQRLSLAQYLNEIVTAGLKATAPKR